MTVVQTLLDEPTSIKCEAYWSVHMFQKCPVSEAAGGRPCAAEISMHSSEEEEISIEISC